jgi:hypothetical protein
LTRDERAGRGWIEAVLDHDRDRFGDSRSDRPRVQDLRAKGRQLARLFVGHLRQHERRRDRFGIGAEHAVDVGPDLDYRRAERRGHDSGRVVGSVSADGRRAAVRGAADESSHDRNRPGPSPQRREVRTHRRGRLRKVHVGARELFVGGDEPAGIDESRPAKPVQIRRHDECREPLAEAGHTVEGGRRTEAEPADAVQRVA